MSITVPPRLEKKLSDNEGLHAGVHSTLAEFATWMSRSGTPLFPEYTDHGPEHVEKVLATASSLIRDEAWDTVTPMDAALLILATLLHDSAMHLSEDGFLELVDSAATGRRIPAFDEGEWPSLWATFLHRARRWDGKQRIAVFGEDGEGVEIKRELPPKGQMTLHDRMLYGEFIRRHHGRFAHEVALFGVPRPGTPPLNVSGELAEDLRDLAGLLARSHSLPVREIIPYLNERYRAVEYKGSHPVFLATLIRTGDYLEVCPERAPEAVLKVARLLSPVSRREWDFNQAVSDVSTHEDDPEAVFVTARPEDVRTYLKIREWLDGLQAELDASWAVLGEVYGRHKGLSLLGLTIRRVQSNLDDVEAFAGQVNYVPRRVRMEVARSDVLPLLVRPLYNEDPSVGVRELMQNALDAVRELRDYLDGRPAHPAPDTYDHEGDVEIWIGKPGEDGGLYVTVTDKGIGMTEEVVRDFFLTAGATYRHSDEWKDMHERPDVEGETTDEPVSRVLRSGRFGVGVLAAFLLGEEITVTTRHVTAPPDRALRFTLVPDAETIEITYCEAPVGTRVEVHVAPGIGHRLQPPPRASGAWRPLDVYNRYALDDPRVVLRYGPEGVHVPQEDTIPGPGAQLPLGWHRIEARGYEDVQWSAWGPPLDNLVCNGIRVSARGDLGTCRFLSGLTVEPGVVSVFDPDGRLPLNLTRSSLATSPSFHPRLQRDVIRWMCAWLLRALPELSRPAEFIHESSRTLMIPATQIRSTRDWWYVPVATTNGYTILETLSDAQSDAFRALAVAHVRLSEHAEHHHPLATSRLDAADLVITGPLYPDLSDIALLTNATLSALGLVACSQAGGAVQGAPSHAQAHALTDVEFVLAERMAEGAWARLTLVNPDALRSISRRGPEREFVERRCIRESGAASPRVVLESPNCPPTCLNTEEMSGPLVVLEFGSEHPPRLEHPDNLVREVWMEVFDGCPVIPFSMEERRTKLAAAWERLEPYMASVEHFWEAERRRMGRGATGDE